jgi:hypothetical protein
MAAAHGFAMSGTEIAILVAAATVVAVLGALAVRHASPAPTRSFGEALLSLKKRGQPMGPVVGTMLMVAVTVVLAAVLYLMVAGFARS